MNKYKIWFSRFCVYLLAVILVACNLPSNRPVPPTLPFPTFIPSLSPAPTFLLPTPTAQPSLTSTSITFTSSTNTPLPIPCNRAEFVSDVTIPDGMQIVTGVSYTKIWRLRNTGSCTWTSGYVLFFDHGDLMDSPATQPLTSGSVPPGAVVDVSVTLKAPSTPGTYQSHFRLRSPDHIVFGIGPSGQGTFWAKIVAPPKFEQILYFTGGGQRSVCNRGDYPGHQPSFYISQEKHILYVCIYVEDYGSPFRLEFQSPGGITVQPINLLAIENTTDISLPKLQWEGYGEDSSTDIFSFDVIETTVIQTIENTVVPTTEGIVIPTSEVIVVPTRDIIVLPTRDTIEITTVDVMEIAAWIPNYFPTGAWQVRASGGFEAASTFMMAKTSPMSSLAAVNPNFGSQFDPIFDDRGYLSLHLLKLKENGGINVIGTDFPPNTLVYILLYHDIDSGIYQLENQQTIQTDSSGSISMELSGPFNVGDSYLIFGVTDPNTPITENSAAFNSNVPHDFFKLVSP